MEVKCGTIYPYNGTLLLGHRKGWDTDAYYNMDDPKKNIMLRKEPDSKGTILDDPIYVKCPE